MIKIIRCAIILKIKAILLESALNLQKLVSVLAISILITDSGKKIIKLPCIYYLVYFQEGQEKEGQEQI